MMLIRPLRAADWPQVDRLENGCRRAGDEGFGWRDHARLCHGSLDVAVRSGRIVGAVASVNQGNRLVLRYLAVAPDLRRTGIGRQLVRHLKMRLCPAVDCLEAAVPTENVPAQGLLLDRRFACCGRVTDYDVDPPAESFRYRFRLRTITRGEREVLGRELGRA